MEITIDCARGPSPTYPSAGRSSESAFRARRISHLSFPSPSSLQADSESGQGSGRGNRLKGGFHYAHPFSFGRSRTYLRRSRTERTTRMPSVRVCTKTS